LPKAGRPVPVLADRSPALLIEPLSTNGVPIFAISTYDTDYVLISKEHIDRAVDLLHEAGHQLLNG
jgi:uncharacterized protein